MGWLVVPVGGYVLGMGCGVIVAAVSRLPCWMLKTMDGFRGGVDWQGNWRVCCSSRVAVCCLLERPFVLFCFALLCFAGPISNAQIIAPALPFRPPPRPSRPTTSTNLPPSLLCPTPVLYHQRIAITALIKIVGPQAILRNAFFHHLSLSRISFSSLASASIRASYAPAFHFGSFFWICVAR